MCFINRYLEDLEIAAVRTVQPTMGAAQPRVQRWIAPGENSAKINVDGGLSRNGCMSAAAAVYRDKDGKYLGASATIFEGLVDAPSLEACACNEALSLAKDLNITHVIIASNCMQVGSDINQGAHSPAQTWKPYAQDNPTRARTQSNGDERRGREPACILATFIHWVWHISELGGPYHTALINTQGWSLYTRALTRRTAKPSTLIQDVANYFTNGGCMQPPSATCTY